MRRTNEDKLRHQRFCRQFSGLPGSQIAAKGRERREGCPGPILPLNATGK